MTENATNTEKFAALKKAVSGYNALPKDFRYCDEGQQWLAENGLSADQYNDGIDIEYFFRSASRIGKDDKYVSDRFVLRSCPRTTPTSYFAFLFEKFEIDEILVTPEANGYTIAALMANGYAAQPVKCEMTEAWAKSASEYGHCILLTKDMG